MEAVDDIEDTPNNPFSLPPISSNRPGVEEDVIVEEEVLVVEVVVEEVFEVVEDTPKNPFSLPPISSSRPGVEEDDELVVVVVVIVFFLVKVSIMSWKIPLSEDDERDAARSFLLFEDE